MPQATFYFPRGFLWGTATSAHQVEGDNTNNNWSTWEQEPGRIIQGQEAGLACDWWGGRWREDFDRAAESGQNAHRLSVEWSRIQPAPDRWDEAALDRYREMLRGLHERNITPLVTLHHVTDPLWLSEGGGWENQAVVEYFEKFVRKTVEALKEYVSLWCTVNEPNIYAANSYITGNFPPGEKDIKLALRVSTNMVRGHAAAYRAIHALQPQARVGITVNYRPFKPARTWFLPDIWIANLYSSLYNEFFTRAITRGAVRTVIGRVRIPEAKGTQDYLGLNYYTRELIAFSLLKAKDVFARRFFDPRSEISDMGFIANEPEGMAEALNWARQFNLPILITENGVEDADDHLRPRYIIQHLHQVWRGINNSLPVKGYFYWTLVDNFEWERGWTQRFGLWELDVETQARRKRPSADLYAEICRENGLSSEMVSKYAPELMPIIFP